MTQNGFAAVLFILIFLTGWLIVGDPDLIDGLVHLMMVR